MVLRVANISCVINLHWLLLYFVYFVYDFVYDLSLMGVGFINCGVIVVDIFIVDAMIYYLLTCRH